MGPTKTPFVIAAAVGLIGLSAVAVAAEPPQSAPELNAPQAQHAYAR